MQRDGFKCIECKSVGITLHVHHKTYIWGNDPWDYPNENFITLCESCHENEESAKIDFNDLVHDLLLMGNSYRDLHIALWQQFITKNASEQKGQFNG